MKNIGAQWALSRKRTGRMSHEILASACRCLVHRNRLTWVAAMSSNWADKYLPIQRKIAGQKTTGSTITRVLQTAKKVLHVDPLEHPPSVRLTPAREARFFLQTERYKVREDVMCQ
ncbi:uncharacterized protein MELLADRAFT_112297 [Melampsora larici-populina 98AG31]|uniref:Uncharacterized protein n=1 Tax=Melampsora larici-populina (strain 98AG31 / pathotype 3-4-7) TaxID=747676 RepID=F4S616_MELLP|nr:uncharacterized protein MELLADRAFT_112297 [Melampsora larici-populina 98AG31]EGF99919.1 hypothetical protein MELLADRAFT_112297 [Melampsora larici-populina 98AG31]